VSENLLYSELAGIVAGRSKLSAGKKLQGKSVDRFILGTREFSLSFHEKCIFFPLID
jgi:hypothetical protein